MKLTVILTILATAQAGKLPNSCDGIKIGDVFHEKEVLKTELDRPYLLAMDRESDSIYFSYSLNSEDDDCQSARLDVNTKDFVVIAGVNGGFAQAVDPKTHDVYIGGSDGIYKYDRSNNKAELFAARDKNIWTLFYKDVLYYSEFPNQFLYTISDGQTVRFKDLEDTKIDAFLIDEDDDMFFTNATGLYKQKKGTKDDVSLKEAESLSVRGIATDVNGDVFVCFQDGIYAVKKPGATVEKVVDINDAFGVAFDSNNNMIYADSTQLVRLKPNKSC